MSASSFNIVSVFCVCLHTVLPLALTEERNVRMYIPPCCAKWVVHLGYHPDHALVHYRELQARASLTTCTLLLAHFLTVEAAGSDGYPLQRDLAPAVLPRSVLALLQITHHWHADSNLIRTQKHIKKSKICCQFDIVCYSRLPVPRVLHLIAFYVYLTPLYQR